MQTHLFAHENQGGGGIAQAAIPAASYSAAKQEFDALYPGRTLVRTGIKGVE